MIGKSLDIILILFPTTCYVLAPEELEEWRAQREDPEEPEYEAGDEFGEARKRKRRGSNRKIEARGVKCEQ